MATLRLAPGATRLKVVTFTDLHFGVDAQAAAQSLAVMRAVLAAEPDTDLVVYSGDLVNADEMRSRTLNADGSLDAAWFAEQWALAVSPLRHVPHAVALGNHDLRGALNADAILELAMQQNGSLVRRAPAVPSGAASPAAFDYYVDAQAADGSLAHRLWFLNSWDDRCEGQGPWGCVSRGEVAWAAEAAAAAPQPAGDSVAFVHIPLPQLRPDALRGATGVMQESVSCPSVDTGVADWAHSAGIAAVVSGHDHANDYAGFWAPPGAPRLHPDADADGDGAILLAYGRNTGYGGYGPGELQRGARVLELHADGGLRTWVRQEDGSRVAFGAPFQPHKPRPKPFITPHMAEQLAEAALAAFIFLLSAWALSRLRGRRAAAQQKGKQVADSDSDDPEAQPNTLHAVLLSGYNS